MKEKALVLALEGLIGVGKSTLCSKLDEVIDTEVFNEPVNEKFLRLFYNDPKKYGFAFQLNMLRTRITQMRLTQKAVLERNCTVVWDRSMIGDYIFAMWNYISGSLSREEMDVYESELGGSFNEFASLEFLQLINYFILLNGTPLACKRRVETRGIEAEKEIPLPYYIGLDDIHFSFFLKLYQCCPKRVMVFNWGQYEDAELFLSLIKMNVVQGRTGALCSRNEIMDFTYPEGELSIDDCVRFFRVAAPPPLKIGISSKNCIYYGSAETTSRCQEYKIQFYTDTYKRVVLAHLNRGDHVLLME